MSPIEPDGADAHAEHAADDREHDGFDHQLTDDRAASAAERHAGRDLLGARAAAREQQRRQIHARDEQHRADRRQQHHDRLALVADDDFLQRQQAERHRGVFLIAAIREQLRPRERRHLAVGVGPRRVGPHAHDHPVVRAAAFAVRVRPERRPHVRVAQVLKRGRHHADDRHRLTLQSNRLADDVLVAVEEAPPDGVAENRRLGTAVPIFIRRELAADRRLHAEHAEVSGAHALLRDRACLSADDEIHAAAAGEIGIHRRVQRGHVIADRLPDEAVLRRVRPFPSRRSRVRDDGREPIGLRIRQRLHQQRVGDAHHRRVAADHERERRDRGQRERGRPSQHPQRIANVAG